MTGEGVEGLEGMAEVAIACLHLQFALGDGVEDLALGGAHNADTHGRHGSERTYDAEQRNKLRHVLCCLVNTFAVLVGKRRGEGRKGVKCIT